MTIPNRFSALHWPPGAGSTLTPIHPALLQGRGVASRAGSSAPGSPRLVPRGAGCQVRATAGERWQELPAPPRPGGGEGGKVLSFPGLLRRVIAAAGLALLSARFNISPSLRTR